MMPPDSATMPVPITVCRWPETTRRPPSSGARSTTMPAMAAPIHDDGDGPGLGGRPTISEATRRRARSAWRTGRGR